jgi:hypothetical protein
MPEPSTGPSRATRTHCHYRQPERADRRRPGSTDGSASPRTSNKPRRCRKQTGESGAAPQSATYRPHQSRNTHHRRPVSRLDASDSAPAAFRHGGLLLDHDNTIRVLPGTRPQPSRPDVKQPRLCLERDDIRESRMSVAVFRSSRALLYGSAAILHAPLGDGECCLTGPDSGGLSALIRRRASRG